MSTFGGLIEEIAKISIDKFDGPNLNSKLFFLSHCHTDHMVGLFDAKNDLPGPLYLSEVSAVFVQRKFPHLKNLKTLKIGQPTILSIDDESDAKTGKIEFTVTSIPAGHCPGSVMFMFEKDDKRVLYTGDFRLNQLAIETITAFRDMRNDVLAFDSIYIDSTFLSLRYLVFPTQRQSVDQIIALTTNWLTKNDKNVAVIRPPANYGYEFLLGRLAEYFANEIHLSSANVGDYNFIPELDGCYTACVSSKTRIHFQCAALRSNWSSKTILCCPSLHENHIRIIRPTAFKWTDWRENDPLFAPHEDMPETFFVCYSNHSSYTEIKQLIQFIDAKNVKFNVMPTESNRRVEMLAAYRQIVRDKNGTEDEPEPEKPIVTFSRIVINDCDRSGDNDDTISRPKLKRRKKAI